MKFEQAMECMRQGAECELKGYFFKISDNRLLRGQDIKGHIDYIVFNHEPALISDVEIMSEEWQLRGIRFKDAIDKMLEGKEVFRFEDGEKLTIKIVDDDFYSGDLPVTISLDDVKCQNWFVSEEEDDLSDVGV